MEYWEFLLQKEGDRTWLPLESAEVEILEGRYRLMAHASQANVAVEVRISQLLLDEIPPKRRVLKRQGQTNQDGLMVVMPFTQLQAGTWEVQCVGGDPLNDLMGDSWQQTIQFQILPRNLDETDDWEANWTPVLEQETVTADQTVTSSETAATASLFSPNSESIQHFERSSLITDSEATVPPKAVPPVWEKTAPLSALSPDVEEIADQLIGEVFGDILASDQAATEADSHPESVAASHLPLQIELDQATYLIRSRQALRLQVQIQATATYSELPESKLQLTLRNPQTSEVLDIVERSLQAQPLPADLGIEVKLPAAKTHLILGELTLQSFAQEAIAAAQTFTIAVMLDNLIETVADQGEYLQDPSQWHRPLETAATEEAPSAAAETIEAEQKKSLPVRLPKSSAQSGKPVFLPSVGMFLPPQIHEPLLASSSTADTRTPMLPSLPAIRPQQTALPEPAAPSPEPDVPQDEVEQPETNTPTPRDSVTEAEVAEASEESLAAGDEAAVLAEDASPEVSPAEATSRVSPVGHAGVVTADEADADADLIAAAQEVDLEQGISADLALDESTEDAAAPVDTAFQSLNLKERFWSRLNAFALDSHRAAQEMQAAIEHQEAAAAAANAEMEAALQPEAIASNPSPVTENSSDEFVVYDAVEQPAPAVAETAAAAAEKDIKEIAELPPVPRPQLKVPVGNLVAGELISIQIMLPATPERLCVKFWTSDLQTRALVDNPRWLMSFDPDGQGQMSTTLRISVPQGCLEARFAAIAIDVVSQRESDRVVVDRAILPADLPDTSLDEFEV
ncbi:MAG: hypothetical protein F6K04_12035 [Leptolyngbya sp. SIO4C5]|nr:hypothetical protein [Leptolyngbya sp. SIO4C5]